MIDFTQAARADRTFRNGSRKMIAWAGRCLRLAVRTVIPAVKVAHHEQVSMWECILLTSAAAPLTAVGPLRWFRRWTVTGSPAATCRPGTQAKQLGNQGWRPSAKIPAPAPPAGSSINIPGRRTAPAAA